MQALSGTPRPTALTPELFEDTRRDLLKWCATFCRQNYDRLRNCRHDTAVVESAAMDGLLKAAEKWSPQHISGASFKTFAFIAARSAVLRAIRPTVGEEAFRTQYTVVSLHEPVQWRNPEGRVWEGLCPEHAESSKPALSEMSEVEIRQVLRQLDEIEERVLLMRFWEKLTMEETAARLGEAYDLWKVRSIQARAISRLRKMLNVEESACRV